MSDSISRVELKELLTEVIVENKESEIGLAEVVKAVRSYGGGALFFGVLFAALVTSYFFIIVKSEYHATAQFLIPLDPEEGSMGQEAYISILTSAGFTDFVREKMPEDLKAKIASESEDPLEEVISFTKDGARLSVMKGRGSELVGVVAKSKDPETSAAFATFVSNEYIDYAADRRNKKLDQDIEAAKIALELNAQLLDETRALLGGFIEKNPILISAERVIPERINSPEGEPLGFKGGSPLKQANGTDLQYYELATSFERIFKSVAESREAVEELELEKKLPFRGLEFLREAEVPLESANSDMKKSVLFIAFAFFFGFGGWIVFRGVLDRLKEVA